MRLGHLGLRAQIVLSLAALLAVVFSFTGMALLWVLRSSLESQRRELGTAAAQILLEGLASRFQSDSSRSLREFERHLESSLGQAGIVSLALYNDRGEPRLVRSLRDGGLDLGGVNPLRPRPFQIARPAGIGSGEELLLVHPLQRGQGSVVAIVSLGITGAELGRLARPVLIYLLTSGLLLLGFGYFSLTSLLVRPLESLTRATEQVALGQLDVTVPVKGGREIASAAAAFNTMTRTLREQKKRLEKHLEELENTTYQLQSTRDQLVRSAKLASVGTLAAGVAHEVGNPVSAILGFSELLLEGSGDFESSEVRGFQERIRDEAERVNRIIRDLLEYARSSPEEVDGPSSVSEAADAAVGLMSPQKTFRLIDIQIIIEDDLPAVAIGMDRLTQVLLNLLLNAADAVAGQGSVSLRAHRVEKVVLDDDELGERPAVLIEVSDTGPGVPEESLDRIFEPFYTTKDPGEGTGLGLAMCESIVNRAGGTVSAHNNPQRGLTISLHLPVVEDDIS